MQLNFINLQTTYFGAALDHGHGKRKLYTVTFTLLVLCNMAVIVLEMLSQKRRFVDTVNVIKQTG